MLNEQVAVITGAGRNVGKGIAETFAANGASVVVNDLDKTRAQSVVESLPTDNAPTQQHLTVPGDVTDPDEVASIAELIEEMYGRVDILVNNVGYAVNKSVFETSSEEWDQVLDINLKSGFLCTKHIGQLMADTGGGAIVNLGSRIGKVGSTDKVAYCAAKGGVINMTRQLALDLAEYDIRVNSISPGNAGSPVASDDPRDEFDTSEIPLGRVGTPEDIGKAALFLVSDQADYITGVDLPVDGGKN